VIDIGSAEGYYACGLARMLQVPVYAYDRARPPRKAR
jgi:protein-L-isoaspartate O-methyltransferase